MPKLQVTDPQVDVSTVTSSHFGGNAVYKVNTQFGQVSQSFTDSLEALGARHVRYPSGQGDRADSATDGNEWLNVVTMKNGELREELTRFLDWASEYGHMVTLVIPTKMTDVEGYADFANEIEQFVETVISEYPGLIEAFEIGNEYWEMGETAYAAKANLAAVAISNGVEAAGTKGDDPAILIQMGTPNQGSEFHVSAPGMADIPFATRSEMANQRIIDNLSEAAKASIDGVIEHYYYVRDHEIFTGRSDEFNFIDAEYAQWKDAFDRDLELHITEWNVKTTNIEENGIRSASTLIHMFDNMLEMGTDAASIWAIQHNTSTDLTGNEGDAVRFDDAGRVVSTVRGATFDMLSDSVIGLNRQEVTVLSGSQALDFTAFANDEKTVLYVASRSWEMESVSLDLDSLFQANATVEGLKLGYDASSSNGTHYDYREMAWAKADAVDLNGDGQDDYVINEHDVRAEFTDYSRVQLVDDGEIRFDLKPFEVMQLTLTGTVRVSGSDGDDNLVGTSGNDFIYGDSGSDELRGRDGKDDLIGGKGRDLMFGGAGNDVAHGNGGGDHTIMGKGDDIAQGAKGKDKLKGGAGHDKLFGGHQADTLKGGTGNDTLKGDSGDDVLAGGRGNDLLFGGNGDDLFIFHAGNDRIEDFGSGDELMIAAKAIAEGSSLDTVLSEAALNENGNIVIAFDAENSLELVGWQDATGLEIGIL